MGLIRFSTNLYLTLGIQICCQIASASVLTGSSVFAVLDSAFKFACITSGFETKLSFKRGSTSLCRIDYQVNYFSRDTTHCGYSSVPGYSCSCGESGVFYLNISSVSPQDEDTWRCEDSRRSNSITLPVYYGPYNNITINQTSPVTVIEDVNVSLIARCSAHCKPGCSYTWRRGSQQVSDNRDLSLGSFRRGQEGNYTCRAENTATGDTADSQALTVVVHCNINFMFFVRASKRQYSITSLFLKMNRHAYKQKVIIVETWLMFINPVFNVLDPPGSSPVISGFSSTPVYEGDIVTLSCRVSGGNPLVTSINLTCPGGERSSATSFEGTNTRVTTLNYTVSRDLRSQPCRCSALHSTGRYQLTTEITKEDVYYPPASPPVISGFSSSPVNEGDIVTLFCRVTGGNPLATSVNLTCQQSQQSSFTSNEGTTTRVTTLNYTVSRDLRSQPCRCSAVHSTGRYQLSTEIAKENVFYPPQKPSVSLSPSLPWLEGQSTSVVCQSVDTGYPPASYRWYIDGVLVDQSSQLDFPNVSHEDNQKALYCTATNRFTEVKGLSIKSDPLILDVHYKPVIEVSPQGPVRIPAGSDLVVNCSAVSNPGNPTVSWYLGDTLVSQINSLTLTSATKRDSGIYTCHAVTFSIFGNLTSSHLIDIDVFDKPFAPVQFYCTKQTPSSVTLQWMDVNTFKGNTSFVLEQKFEGDREYSNSNLAAFVSDSENTYEKSVDSLKDSSLYYFRLYRQDHTTRSDPVEATCFTSQDSSSFGAGIGTGIGIMIVFDVIIIIVFVFLFRKRFLGKTNNLNTAKPTNVYENASFDEVNTNTPSPLSDIEETQKSEYAELETREQEPPNTYEKIKTYENA